MRIILTPQLKRDSTELVLCIFEEIVLPNLRKKLAYLPEPDNIFNLMMKNIIIYQAPKKDDRICIFHIKKEPSTLISFQNNSLYRVYLLGY